MTELKADPDATPGTGNKRPWREAVRREAYSGTLREAAARWGTEDHPANYRWTHVRAVVAQAKRLAELTGADAEVCEAAAWLHDSAKKGRDDDHGQAGAENACTVLRDTDFPQDKIAAVADAISKHVGLYLQSPVAPLEAAVLWDADKLTKLGVGGSVMHIATWILTERGSLDSLPASVRDQDWYAKTVESFHTAPAREAGRRRLAEQRAFWAQVTSELAGGDLWAVPGDVEQK